MNRRNGSFAKKIIKGPTGIVCVLLFAAIVYIGGYFTKYHPPEGTAEIHFIDVGQGDAALILSGETAILIDAGTGDAGDTLAAYVNARTDSLDYMILSHPHEDHIGGAPAVLEAVKIDKVIMPDATADSASFDRLLSGLEKSDVELIAAERGDSYMADDLKFEILSPPSGVSYDNANNVSAVVRVDFGNVSFLFTGDAETEIERELMSGAYTYSKLDCDLLKVGHHGSRTSTCKDFLDAVSPEIAVISCGRDNSYGHPHPEIIDRLTDYGCEIYRTDRSGSIVFETDGTEIAEKK